MKIRCRRGEIGIRKGLKIPPPRGDAGSSPAAGTTQGILWRRVVHHGDYRPSPSSLSSSFQTDKS